MKKFLKYLSKLNEVYNNILFRDINFKELFHILNITKNLNKEEFKNYINNTYKEDFEWIKDFIKDSEEYKFKLKLNNIYNIILSRDIDKDGYLSYLKQFENNILNFNEIEDSLYKSKEYISNKLYGIDKIFYINLNISKKRNEYMINLLNNLSIEYERFEATYGDDINFNNFIFNNEKLLNNLINFKNISNNYEIACTVSHLKLINKIKKCKGRYFLVLEDDANFDNLRYFKNNLKKIIDEAPNFDILLLYKTSEEIPENLYEKWDLKYSGTVAYIVKKKNLYDLKKFYEIRNEKIYFKKNIKLAGADRYIFKMLKTYVYKYNIISTNCDESIIHKEHLEFHKICINKNNLKLKNLK